MLFSKISTKLSSDHTIKTKTKHYFLTTCAMLSMLLLLPQTSSQVEAKELIANDGVRIRKEANVESDIVLTIYQGTSVTIEGKEGNWYQVSYGDTEGYIYKDFLSKDGKKKKSSKKKAKKESSKKSDQNTSKKKSSNKAKAISTEGLEETFVNSDDVNLRAKSNSDSKVLGVYNENDPVYIVEELDSWTEVVTEDQKQGFIYRKYLGKKCEKPDRSKEDVIEEYMDAAIDYAKDRIGDKYSQTKRDSKGYADCSSLVRDAFEHAADVFIGDTTVTQSDKMDKYMYSIDTVFDVDPGDLIYHIDGTDNHVGLYLGNGSVLHASKSRGKVCITEYDKSNSFWTHGCRVGSFCYDALYSYDK